MNQEEWVYQPNAEIPPNHSLPEAVVRLAMGVEYQGSAYCGWQRQSHSPSVQARVEQALSFVANEPIQVVCAGRTDTAVHGTGQVIHFDTRALREPRNWLLGSNSRLPDDIAITWAVPVVPQFHARFSARARTYRYFILNQAHSPAIFRAGLTWEPKPLNSDKMHAAAQYLLGEQDFSSFRAAGCQSKSPMREVKQARVVRAGDLVMFEIKANAFLHHMVRNFVGLLLKIGASDLPADEMARVLALRDRTQSAPTAPPEGLYLVEVEYPPEFNLPNASNHSGLLAALAQLME